MTTATPTPSPVASGQKGQATTSSSSPNQDQESITRDNVPSVPSPTLRLHIQDLRHPAAISFLRLLPDITTVLETALAAIIQHLYTPPSTTTTTTTTTSSSSPDIPPATQRPLPSFTPSVPPTRSVTVILRDFSGVAYTTGTDLDDDHKEIHFSLAYIRTCATYADPVHELAGVLTHELVHCYQHTAPPGGKGHRPPGGLIEGIADFVRLKAGLEPPHWKRPTGAKERAPKWDQGYQHTAFFLAWLEDVRVGMGAVGMLNDRLLRVGYIAEVLGDGEATETDSKGKGQVQDGFWKGLFGVGVSELWEEYGQYLDGLGEHRKADRNSPRGSGNWEEEILNPE